MSTPVPRTLWSDSARTRFFLIPERQEIPQGEFQIRTITCRELTADPAILMSFEISKSDAKRYLESELGKMLDIARGAVDGFIDRLRAEDSDPLAPIRDAIETLRRH